MLQPQIGLHGLKPKIGSSVLILTLALVDRPTSSALRAANGDHHELGIERPQDNTTLQWPSRESTNQSSFFSKHCR